MLDDITGNLLRWRSEVITRKHPVQIQVVNWRGASACAHRWRVEGREQYELAAYILSFDFPNEFGNHHRPLVLVAVDRSRHHHDRPVAVLDGCRRVGNHAPCVVVGRMG
jgi:hypothetical protein